MLYDKDIEDRTNHILGVVAPQAAQFREVLATLADLISRSESVAFARLKASVLNDTERFKYEMLESACNRIARCESESVRYGDDQLADKISQDLASLTKSIAQLERGPSGLTH